jgi:hypothetical protein
MKYPTGVTDSSQTFHCICMIISSRERTSLQENARQLSLVPAWKQKLVSWWLYVEKLHFGTDKRVLPCSVEIGSSLLTLTLSSLFWFSSFFCLIFMMQFLNNLSDVISYVNVWKVYISWKHVTCTGCRDIRGITIIIWIWGVTTFPRWGSKSGLGGHWKRSLALARCLNLLSNLYTVVHGLHTNNNWARETTIFRLQ